MDDSSRDFTPSAKGFSASFVPSGWDKNGTIWGLENKCWAGKTCPLPKAGYGIGTGAACGGVCGATIGCTYGDACGSEDAGTPEMSPACVTYTWGTDDPGMFTTYALILSALLRIPDPNPVNNEKLLKIICEQ